MQDDKQFEQLILQYTQLKNGAIDIRKMIENEDFDSALTMVKLREEVFLSCKCMRKYLELTPEQEKNLNELLEELRELELENIRMLSKRMDDVKFELRKTQKTEKIQHAYDFNENQSGNFINVEE
ncbi:flagellar protein FliT [bacterium]|nr:flagellar protein FliT [bacterium]